MSRLDQEGERRHARADAYDEALAATYGLESSTVDVDVSAVEAPLVRHFTAVDLSELSTRSYQPPDFVISKLVPRGFVTLLGGHGGMGKSMLACVLACHVVAGREWCGFGVAKLPVTILTLEDDGALVRMRLKWVAQAYGLPFDAIEQGITILDGTEGEGVLAAEINSFGTRSVVPTAAWQEAVERTEGAGLIIVDNASDAYGGNENQRAQVRAFIRQLASLATLRNAGVMLLAHIDKQAAKFGGNGNTYSGSTAWHNGPRSRLALIERDGSPSLVHEKLNLGRPHEAPVALSFNERGVLVPGWSASGGDRETNDEALVLEAIERGIRAGITVPTATFGPATVGAALDPYLGGDLRDKRRINAAIVRLQERGRITRVKFKDKYRNERERWELTHPEAHQASEEARQ